ncbi:hypothetical protein [Actinorugispora endophytica]|uniref:Uncharacterized protein n=1 Tax=Actinorugispora endophytica TaxID=1605990 RepID=A0A4R6VAQ0_9ACTN|nr:hypothetical protein [Actinorugispora endophytica]TDQ53717.1 hypothetical protein EV190_103168 [Actinorugispora endophytica]
MFAIDGDLKAILEIPGARSISLLDSGRVVAEFGHDTAFPREENRGAAGVVHAIADNPAFVSMEIAGALEDLVLTTRYEYLLVAVVRVPGRSRCRLQLRLDRGGGNLALGRQALRRLAARLGADADAGPPAWTGGPLPRRRYAVGGADGGAVSLRRAPNPGRPARGTGGGWSPPDRATLERVLGALRSLCAPPAGLPGRVMVRAEAT